MIFQRGNACVYCGNGGPAANSGLSMPQEPLALPAEEHAPQLLNHQLQTVVLRYRIYLEDRGLSAKSENDPGVSRFICAKMLHLALAWQ